MKIASRIIGLELAVLGLAILMTTQPAHAQLAIGENTKLTAGGLFSFGYAGDYGDAVPSSHGLNIGVDGKLDGYYYNPSFISFSATPYYNQSRSDSSYQSLTGASGVQGTANFFTGSHFPGSATYNYTENSTGTFGLAGQPNFTTYGKGQGFGINWSALLPNWPTLSVGYSQGSGHSTLYGTSEESDSSTRLFNAHSNYQLAGFRLTGFFNHNSLHSDFPEFLAGEGNQVQESSSHDFGFGAQHKLPVHGSFYVTYDRASASSDFLTDQGNSSNNSSYTDSNETASASFQPTQKFGFNFTQNYTGNLSGYLTQNLSGGAVQPGQVNLGSGSHSLTLGGGANYRLTNYLSTTAEATYYDQFYFGKSYTGEYIAGTVNYNKRLWDMFTFSASVIDSSNGQGQNALGFIGNVNFYHRIGKWKTTGQFSYAQNVQTLLITYTTSYYQYRANLSRRLPGGMSWIAAFNGNHSGLTNFQGSSSHGEGYSTSLGMRQIQASAFFSQSSGVSLLGAGGLIQPNPTPGLTDFIFSNGSSYGGGLTVSPVKRMSISGTFSRSISNTLSTEISHNDTKVLNAQMQYHLRRIGLQAGYLRFSQGISAIGAPVNTTSYFVGMTRWFDFF